MILDICLILYVLLDYYVLLEKYPSESIYFLVCYRMYNFEYFDILCEDFRWVEWIL